MKKYISIIILLFASSTLLMCACNKKLDLVDPVSSTDGLAFLKVGDFAPSFQTVTKGADNFNIYVNGNKVNGSALSYGTLFPTTTNPYIGVPSGSQSIRITVNGIITPDSITLASFNKTLIAGAYYSFLISDSLLNANESKQIFVRDNFTIADSLHYSIRFIYAILNDTLGKTVDIYSKRLGANLFSNISPGTTTDFILPSYTFISDTLIVRRPGFSYTLATLNGAILARQRAYTLIYKGQPTATGTKPQSLTTYVNE